MTFKGTIAEYLASRCKRDPKTGCLKWTPSTKWSDGYGVIHLRSVRGGDVLAHRWAWRIDRKREIPPGGQILHTCDIRSCLEPEHLYLGDHFDNMRDQLERGGKTPAAHGTSTKYNDRGCRCGECRAWASEQWTRVGKPARQERQRRALNG